MSDQILTQERLKELLTYDPETGVFEWKELTHGRKSPAGGPMSSGYIQIFVDGKHCYAHRLAWLYMHGFIPDQVDHANGERDDNRLDNLRASNNKDNKKNLGIRSDNTSGVQGVYWHKLRKKWHARINVDGKNINLGLHTSLDSAKKARDTAKIKYGFHEGHGQRKGRP